MKNLESMKIEYYGLLLWISIDDKLTLIYKLYFIIFYNIKNKLCITYMYSAWIDSYKYTFTFI